MELEAAAAAGEGGTVVEQAQGTQASCWSAATVDFEEAGFF